MLTSDNNKKEKPDLTERILRGRLLREIHLKRNYKSNKEYFSDIIREYQAWIIYEKNYYKISESQQEFFKDRLGNKRNMINWYKEINPLISENVRKTAAAMQQINPELLDAVEIIEAITKNAR